MESKYYTPDIEELYVGFECEHTTNMSAFEINDTDRIYNSLLIIHELCDYINWSLDEGLNKFVRVKYLDQEDIESLGWIYTGKAVGLWFNKKGFFDTPGGRHRLTEYKLIYFKDNNELHIEGFFGNISEGMLFEGIIKNKSELKKLLKQLKIE